MKSELNKTENPLVGTYQTLHFDICPRAAKLYSNIEEKGVDMELAKKSAKFHDMMFHMEKMLLNKSIANEDEIEVFQKLHDQLVKMSEAMGLEKEHSYLKMHINKVNKLKPKNESKITKQFLKKLIREEYSKLTEVSLYNTEDVPTENFIESLENFLDDYVPFYDIKRSSVNEDGMLYVTISFQPEDQWDGGYIKNSDFIRLSISDNGIIRLVDYGLYEKGKSREPSNLLPGMRIKPQRASSMPELIVKLRKYVDKLLSYYRTAKKKESPEE